MNEGMMMNERKNERMSDGRMDGWNNCKWTSDVTWLNDSSQYTEKRVDF